MKIAASVLLLFLFALPGVSQELKSTHVFPQVVDGGAGRQVYRTFIFVTHIFTSRVNCTLNLRGGLDNSRLLDNTAGSTAARTITLDTSNSIWLFFTRATAPLAAGFAVLECTGPVSAQATYVLGDGTPLFGTGDIESMATVFSADPGRRGWIWSIQTPSTRLGLAIANNSSAFVPYSVRVTMESGEIKGASFTLPPYSSHSRFVDEAVPGVSNEKVLLVEVVSNSQLHSIGLLFDGMRFTTFPVTIVEQ